MPKKNGKIKTFSFDNDIVEKLEILSEAERRSQTSLIEYMIDEYYRKKMYLERIEELNQIQLKVRQKKDRGDS